MATYSPTPPGADTLEAVEQAVLLDFGTDWCGYCRRAQGLVASVMRRHPEVLHLRVEDGPGRPLGRSFRVKLWPTLILLSHGKEVARVVRPEDESAIEALFEARLEGA